MRQRYDILGVSILALSISIESTYAACTANSPTYYCASGYYGNPTSASGTCYACPAAQHGGFVASNKATTKTGCYETYTPDNCSAGTVKSYYSSTGTGTYSSDTTRVSALTPNNGYYVASSTAASCTPCPTSDHTGWAVGSNATASTYGPSNNCFITGTPDGCASGTAKLFYCDSANGYCDLQSISGQIYPAKSGYYNTTSGFVGPTCTACPAADDDWEVNSYSNARSWSQCSEIRTPEGCASGLLRRDAISATAYGSARVYEDLTNLPGYYADGDACVHCPWASNSWFDIDLTDDAYGTSSAEEATGESDCYLDSAETYYDETGSFQLTDDCYYDSSATEDLL